MRSPFQNKLSVGWEYRSVGRHGQNFHRASVKTLCNQRKGRQCIVSFSLPQPLFSSQKRVSFKFSFRSRATSSIWPSGRISSVRLSSFLLSPLYGLTLLPPEIPDTSVTLMSLLQAPHSQIKGELRTPTEQQFLLVDRPKVISITATRGHIDSTALPEVVFDTVNVLRV